MGAGGHAQALSHPNPMKTPISTPLAGAQESIGVPEGPRALWGTAQRGQQQGTGLAVISDHDASGEHSCPFPSLSHPL